MRAFIDTNIFVYASYPSFSHFHKAQNFLKRCLKGPDSWCLSWGVVYEYLSVVTNPKLFYRETLSFKQAFENVIRFTRSSYVDILIETSDHEENLRELEDEPSPLQGTLLHDAHHVVLMREHEIKIIYTADTDFNRFRDIEVMNPFFQT